MILQCFRRSQSFCSHCFCMQWLSCFLPQPSLLSGRCFGKYLCLSPLRCHSQGFHGYPLRSLAAPFRFYRHLPHTHLLLIGLTSIGGGNVTWRLEHRTCNRPRVQVLPRLLKWFVYGSPEFKSSVTLVNSQLVCRWPVAISYPCYV